MIVSRSVASDRPRAIILGSSDVARSWCDGAGSLIGIEQARERRLQELPGPPLVFLARTEATLSTGRVGDHWRPQLGRKRCLRP